MDAVVIRSYDDGPALESLTIDEPRAGEVLVALAASGVCGSDIHAARGESNAGVLPMVAGHEGSGVVEAVGRASNPSSPATTWCSAPTDRVTSATRAGTAGSCTARARRA
jgi:D-arabinose 1-dehydrogenase-like Zn-dependent alcohol dehydrogenase